MIPKLTFWAPVICLTNNFIQQIDFVTIVCKQCKNLNERKLELTTGRNQTLENTACLREQKLVMFSRYTEMDFNGLHYGCQGIDIIWLSRSLVGTR